MKRQILKALTVLLIISALTGGMAACGKKEKAQMSDGTFTVGFDAEFPPYGYKDESGEYVGFDLDLAQEVCNRNGWTLVKQPIDWDSKDMELNSGTISCIWNGFTMNGREDDYTWTKPYVDNSQVVVVRKDSGITQLSDLSGKVVAVQGSIRAPSRVVLSVPLPARARRGVSLLFSYYCFVVLPQISQILTDVVFLEFCEFCVFCGTFHAPVNLCKSV